MITGLHFKRSLLVLIIIISFDKAYAQIQPMYNCFVNSISPTSVSAGSGSGQVNPTITVNTSPASCTTYSISTSYGWIHYVRSAGSVVVSVDANTGSARTGTINIGGQFLTVNQACGNIPVAPLRLTVDRNNFCSNAGGNIILSVVGGSGSNVRWFTESCGGAQIDITDGSLEIAAPTITTKYYARWETDCSYSICKYITVNVITVGTPSVSGTTTVCAGSTYNYSATAVSGATSYTWTIPSGASGTSTTESINVTFGTNSGSVSAVANNSGGCTSLPGSLPVNVSYVYPYSITGGGTTCPGVGIPVGLQGSTNSITYKLYLNGSWQSGDIIVGNGGNNVSWNKSAPGTYTIMAVSGTCEVPMSGSVSITNNIQSSDPVSISATANPMCLGAGTTLTVNGGSLGTGASWKWYTGGCGTTLVYTGNSFAVNPSSTTTYWVRAEGTCNTTACAAITVNVTTPPTITQQPQSQTICTGAAVSFNVSASGGLSYQWQNKVGGIWSDIPGATGTTYSISNTTGMDGRGYKCIVTGPCSFSTATNEAYIIFSYLYPYTIRSANTTICPGTTNEITLNGSSTDTRINYYCYHDGSILYPPVHGDGSGGPISFGNHNIAGEYTAKAVNLDGCVVPMDGSVTVTVKTPSTPATSINATLNNICPGTGTRLTLAGGSLETGTGVWHWYSGDDPCGSAPVEQGTNSISVNPTVTTTYYVRAEGGCLTTSCVSVSVTVEDLPSITSQPQDATITPDQDASFSVSATGSGLIYQWQSSLTGTDSWTDLTGPPAVNFNTPTLTIQGSSSNNSKYFMCRITSDCESIFSNSVKLTVALPGITYLSGTEIVDPLNRTLNKSLEVGSLPGEINVNNLGAAIYQIPIFVSPGTAGMQPQISISYNNLLKDGLLGRGWDIAGLSTIQRVARNYYNDGETSGVGLQNTDKFALDSNRLILTSGSYGADGSVYSTELETFVQVTAHGDISTGPGWFEVKTKDGKTLEYGNTVTSKVEAIGSSAVNLWRLNRIKDQSGNYIDFTYFEVNGESYIESIKYTGNLVAPLTPYNTIKFSYASKADVNFLYTGGKKIPNSVILTSLRMETENNVLVREYKFKYVLDFYTHLKEIIEYGSDNKSMNSTVIGWGTPTSLFSSNNSFSNNRINKFYHGDFNGDGRTDFVVIEKKSSYNSTDKWELYLSQSDGIAFTKKNEGLLGVTFKDFYVADVDGNGNDEILKKDAESINPTQVSFLNYSFDQSAGLVRGDSSYDLVFNNANPDIYIIPADFEGNGKPDYLTLLPTKSLYLTKICGVNRLGMSFTNPDEVRIVDFDGDGRKEILVITGSTSNVYQYNVVNESFSSIYTSTTFPTNSDRIFTGDFNGDKKTDILAWHSVTGWSLNFASGTGYEASPSIPALIATDPNGSILDNNYYISDLNGDGKDDIIEAYKYSSSSKLNIFYSVGNGIFINENNSFSKTNINQDYLSFGDFNGDGNKDLFFYDYSAAANTVNVCFFHKDENKHMVSSIANGLNFKTKITYDRLNSGPSFYVRYSTATFPVYDYCGPLYAVSKVETDNGLDAFFTTTYTREGAKIHRQGRNFMGFIKTSQPTEAKNSLDIRISELDPVYYFLKTKEEYRYNSAGEDDLVEINKYAYNVKDFGNKRIFQYADTITNTNKLLQTTLISTYVYDDYGNLRRSKTIYRNDEPRNIIEAVKTTTNVFGQYGNYGIPNRLTLTTDSSTYTNQPSYVRAKSFTYNSNGLLLTEKVDPGKSREVTTTYSSFNSFGLPEQTTISASGLTSRSTVFEYDNKGRFVTKVTDPLSNYITKTYNSGTGNIETETSVDGQTTTYLYDGLGRKVETITPLSKHITTSYSWNETFIGGATYSLYAITTDATDLPFTRVYFDGLGRELRSQTENPGGVSSQDKYYNSSGQLCRESFPYFGTEYPQKWRYLTYDYYGRLKRDSVSSESYTSYGYQGKTTSLTKGRSYEKVVKINSLGNTVYSSEMGSVVNSSFGSNGQVKQMDADGTIVRFNYDEYGRQDSIINPNSGKTSYHYNAFGELTSQTDAKGNTISLQYDISGRVSSKTNPEGTTSYVYVSSGNGKGQIQSITGPDNISQTYVYDSNGRATTHTEAIPGDQSFTTTVSYDNWNNPITITYPSGFTTTNVYANGYLTSIRKADNSIIWKADSINAEGQPIQFTLGPGGSLIEKFGYDFYGKLTSKKVDNCMQSFYYDNTLNNILERSIMRQGSDWKTETFTYDPVNRLSTSAAPDQSMIEINYDSRGNITSKSGIGNYKYNETKVNRLDSIAADSMYTPLTDHSIDYTSDNLTSAITQDPYHLRLIYGPSGARIKTVLTENGDTIKTKYFSQNYEKEIKGSVVREMHYLYSPYGLIGVMIKQGTNENIYYAETDQLGSIISLLNSDGTYAEKYLYDAWGRRRNPDTWSYDSIPAATLIDRGFTGHEHLDEFGLINMNGRMYDPYIGRFLGVDPYIQNAENSQSFNGYGYCLNNPLIYTDPSGYLFASKDDPGCGTHNSRNESFWESISHFLDEVFGGGGNGYSDPPYLFGYNYTNNTGIPYSSNGFEGGQPGGGGANPSGTSSGNSDLDVPPRKINQLIGSNENNPKYIVGCMACHSSEGVYYQYLAGYREAFWMNVLAVAGFAFEGLTSLGVIVEDGAIAINGLPKSTPRFKIPTNPPQKPPTLIPKGYNLRVMGPTKQYPNGYWVLEKPMPQGGFQKINPSTMKPGPNWDTHIPLP